MRVGRHTLSTLPARPPAQFGKRMTGAAAVTFSGVNAPVRASDRLMARLKDMLRPFVSALPPLSGLPSWPRAMVLKRHGFSAATVFDIGVGYGTFPLYRAFPDAHYHLIDPARESLAYMRRLSGRLRCEVHSIALGDRDGESALEVRADELFGPIARPAACKIDAQGAKLMVLAGMTGRLAEIDVVETSTIATVMGGAEVAGVVRFLGDHGFCLADIAGLRRRPLEGATGQPICRSCRGRRHPSTIAAALQRRSHCSRSASTWPRWQSWDQAVPLMPHLRSGCAFAT